MIRLPLIPICQSPGTCNVVKLAIEETCTEEEKENFSKEDWQDYAKGYYERRLLPEIATPRYYSERIRTPIIPLAGKHYKVSIESQDWQDEQYEADGRFLVLEETEEPITKQDARKPDKNSRWGHYWKFFGQPSWIQNEFFPADANGEPCRHFCTVENGWGDCGNWNILVSLDESGLPIAAYFEASCC